jgi:PBSX family phage portal protein
VIAPRYNLEQLSHQKERSTELGQNIAAMVTNIVGFGWQLREVQMPEGFREKYKDEIQDERFRLLSLLDSVHPVMSLTAVRRKIKDDQHSCGNGYMELIDNQRGELVGVNHVLGHTVRLTEKDKKPTRVEVPRVRPDKNYTVEQVPMYYRFRKYGIVRSGKPLWFKEAGDPRTLDKRSGKYEDNLPFSRRATSLIHFHNYSPMTPYGLPLWIGNLFSVYGSRQAEEINYSTLANNAVPSMFVICENGALTDASIERLREWTEEQIQKSLNRSKFILLEGEAMEEGAPTPSTFKIRVEPLKNLQQDDQLFQAYDQNNRDKLRQAFRLPPLFVGRSEDYTRATADTSRDIADEQVFAPERTEDDWMINRFVLQRWGSRYHFLRSNHPNITDDIELIRLMAIAEKSGAMTPRRADRIVRDVFGDNIGPMPSGIDLDKPFSITFAEAQQGASSPGGGDTATRVVENLLELRTKIEKELDRRYYLEEEDEV